MFKKNVKFREQIAGRIGTHFELPESVLASVVPKNAEQVEKSSSISSSAFERFGRGRP